jgi:transposase-like protein
METVRMRSRSKYAPTGSAACFLVTDLAKRIKDHLVKSGIINRSDRETVIKGVLEGLRDFVLDGQSFEYEYQLNHLGGARWFAKCPKCSARCVKLYRPDVASGKEPRFLCAKCHGLKSPSALYGPTAQYKDVLKPLKRMSKIREILNTGKKLPDARAKELMEEHEFLKNAMMASTTYQRYKFELEANGLLKGIAI